MSSSDMPSRFSCVDQPADRGLLLARNQVRRELERRLSQQLIEELAAHRLPLLGPDPALQGLAHCLDEATPRCRR